MFSENFGTKSYPPMRKVVLSFIVLALSANIFSAQIVKNNDAEKLVKGSKQVSIDEKNKTIKDIHFKENAVKANSENEVKKALKGALALPKEFDLRQKSVSKDKFGTYYKYAFTYNGIPIESYGYNVQVNGEGLRIANGHYKLSVDKKAGNQTKISQEQVLNKALEYIKGKTYQWEVDKNFEKPQGELCYIEKNGQLVLVYKIDIYCAEPLRREFVYVNAETGEIEQSQNRIQIYTNNPGTAVTKYQGTKTITTDYYSGSYRLRENARGNGVETYDLNNGTSYSSAIDFTDDDNNWNTTTSQDNAAYDAHFGSEATYDYFSTHFGRNSIDGSGFALKSYVHYSSNYVNAYWNGTCMTYGDGDGSSYTPLTSIDIVAHEITHGLTSYTADLNYSYESGALNESFSDIFGVAVDYFANPTTANFLMGESINISRTPFRSMINPNLYEQPDTYLGTYWYTGSGDNGGVHYNSGVQNFWFYLLCVGGSGMNDNGDAYFVSPITMDKAAAIAYRTLTVYLTQTSNYADARTYSIQAAVDLYGECSPEVINVTNAWYAVGVGAEYSNSVTANYFVSQNYFCSAPATAVFTNASRNGTTYSWNFGDAGTSTLANPTHTYTATGDYTVTMIATGSSLCNSSDTITGIIHVTSGAVPTTPSCTPTTVNSTGQYGILNFAFNDINNNSAGASEGYRNNTCAFSTTVTEGKAYNYSVSLGSASNSYVKIWLDLNNDGVFNNTTELLISLSGASATRTGSIIIPHPTVYNAPIRMRVASDQGTGTYIADACTASQYGQIEDYSIIVLQNTLPPVVDFSANNTVINPGQSVNFSDKTLNVPNAWVWTFTGGVPSTSTAQNPVVLYSAVGTYPVKLKVSNVYGQDSITKTGYISVVNSFNMCTTTSTTSTSGKLNDSGGSTGSYQNSESCSFLINPTCASSITLSFTAFATESGYDYFSVYDGTNSSGTLLMRYAGSSLPSSVTATSGKMYITFTTDGSVTSNGFQAEWTSVVPSGSLPVSNFNIGNTNPALAEAVQFTDASTESPNAWAWNFGDGNTSIEKSPKHAYASPGTYTVSLIATNCFGVGTTVSKSITVQGPPTITLNPASFNETLVCNDSISKTLTIGNTGTGTLSWSTPDANALVSDNFDPAVNSAVWQTITNGTAASTCGSYSAPNALYFNGSGNREAITKPINTSLGGNISFYLEISNGSAPCEMADSGEDIVLSYSTNGGSTWTAIRTYITGSYSTFTPITETIPAAAKATATMFKWSQVTNSGVGYDNWSIDNVNISALANSRVRFSPKSGSVNPGGNTAVTLTFKSTGLNVGTYNDSVIVKSNDPLKQSKAIPYTLTITGAPKIATSKACSNFANNYIGSTQKDTVKIYNQGCSVLTITNITGASSVFTVNKTAFSVAPYDSTSIIVSFTPTAVSSYSSNFTIYSNDVNKTLCLTGSGVAAPVISVSPTSLNATSLCKDSVSVPLTVFNTGGNPLQFSIAGNTSAKTEMLVLTYGVDLAQEYLNTMTAINQYFTNYNKTEINTTVPSALEAALVGKKVLLIPEQESGSATTFTGFASVLQNFVNNGGSVVFCGTSISGCIFNTGLFTGTGGTSTTSTVTVANATHPVAEGVAASFIGSNATYTHTITNANTQHIVKYGSYDVVAVREQGKGKVAYVAFDYYAYDINAAKLIANTVKWATTNTFPPYISLSSYADTISAGTSVVLNVKFNANDLNKGIYSDSIIINSNDPLTPILKVPCTFNVTGSPTINLSKACSNFGNVDLGTNKTDTLIILNTGCDTLKVSNISSDLASVTLDKTNAIIVPGAAVKVALRFAPTALGSYNGNLTITNNDAVKTYCLTGTGMLPPVITTSPSSLTVTAGCNDSITIPLTISNATGGRDLNFDILQAKIISDKFDSGIDNTVWQAVNNGVIASTCGTFSAPNALYFNGSGTRDAISKAVNTMAGGTVSFYLEISSGSAPCEMADSGEGVVLSYSTNGGTTWTALKTYLPGSYNGFTLITETLPVAAKSTATLLKWSQPSHSGSGCDNWSLDDVTITALGAGLKVISPSTGTVSAGNSSIVNVKFKTTGLVAGVYNDTIFVNSNDPITPIKKVPCSLTVTGNPKIILSKACSNFGLLDVGMTKKDTLTITNTGCNTLTITNITSTLAAVTISKTTASILPGASDKIIFTFTPSIVGAVSGNVTIFNNDANASYCLTGIGTLPPVIALSPASLSATSLCNDSVTVPLTISNATGGRDLTYTIVDNSNFTDNFENGLGNWTKTGLWGISSTSYQGTGGLSDSPSGYYGNSVSQTIDLTKALTVTNKDSCYISYMLNRSMESCCDYFSTQISVNGGSWTSIASLNGTEAWNLKKYSLASYVTNGATLKVRFSFTSDGSVTYDGVTIDNFKVNGVASANHKYSVDTKTGTVPVGNSSVVNVKFKSTGLNTGTYTDSILVNSNDPVNPIKKVMCTYVVSGGPKMTLSKACSNFGTLDIGLNTRDSVIIANTGCDTLKITNITSSLAAVTVDKTSATILPGASIKVYVRFAPATVGALSGDLTIFNNEANKTYCLSGSGTMPPVITMTPSSISASLSCNDSITIPLTIENLTGGRALTYAFDDNSKFTENFDSGLAKWTKTGLWGITATTYQGSGGLSDSPSGYYANSVSQSIELTGALKVINKDSCYISYMLNRSMEGCCDYLYTQISVNGGAWQTLASVNSTEAWAFKKYSFASYVTNGASLKFRFNFTTDGSVTYDGVTIDNLTINGVNSGGSVMEVTPKTGTVPVGGSTTVNVKYKSAGKLAGVYSDSIFVNSNDPVTPRKKIPCTFTISGGPSIVVTKSCSNFGSLFTGVTKLDTVKIYNRGCGTLNVTNISGAASVFSVNKTVFSLAPNDSTTIIVSFIPTAVTSYNSNFIITSNDVTKNLCLTGTGLSAPAISVSPVTLSATSSCNDSITVPLTIYNTGGSALEYAINGNSTGKIDMLVLTSGVDMTGEYANTMTAINQYFTNYNKTEVNTTTASVLQTALVGKKVLLIPEQETGSTSTFTGFATVLQSFVNNGGSVIFCGMSNGAFLFNTGLFAGTSGTSTTSTLTVNNASHDIALGVPASFTASDATYIHTITNVDAQHIVKYGTYDAVVVREMGKGKVAYVAFDFYAFSANAARLIANTVQWAGKNGFPPFISMASTSGSIPAGNSTVLNVKFKSTGMNNGVYNDSIFINTNDPLHPKLKVPCTFNVTGGPEIVLSKACANFGSINYGLNKKDTLTILNSGCDTLIITNIVSSLAVYSLDKTSAIVLPGASTKLIVTFTPLTNTSYNGTITIYNNDVNKSYCTTGTGMAPPVVTTSPSSLTASLSCNDSITLPLTISNLTGGTALTYEVSNNSFFFENFESGLTKWTKTGSWGITSTTYQGTGGLSDSPSGSYGNSISQSIELTSALKVTNRDSCYVSFMLNRSMETCCDYFYPQISVNGGAWQNLASLNGSETWNLKKYVLTSYVTNGANLKFRFYFTTDGSVTYDGVTIDNVTIKGVSGLNTTFTVSPLNGTVAIGTSSTLNVKFKSTGLSSAVYGDTIMIKTNDPLKPTVKIPTQLTVTSMIPSQPSIISGAVTSNVNKTELYSVSNVAGVTYSWNTSGGTVIGSANSASILWTTIGTQTIVVTPSNACGNGTPRTLSVTISPAVAINDADVDRYKLYPNPTEGVMKLSFIEPFENDYTITLYSGTGKLIQVIDKEHDETETLIDLSGYQRGYYVLKVAGDGKTYYTKVIKK